MHRGRPISPLMLSAAERTTLERWSQRRKTAQAQRARLVLPCATEEANTAALRSTPRRPSWGSTEPTASRNVSCGH